MVTALKHEIGSACRLNFGVGTVPPDSQIGGAPDVEIGNHHTVQIHNLADP